MSRVVTAILFCLFIISTSTVLSDENVSNKHVEKISALTVEQEHKDEHEGHDHGKVPEHKDEHDGHDHGKEPEHKDEHEGHDHGKEPEHKDEHEGHDHGKEPEHKDEHEGHDHGKEPEHKDEHEGHDNGKEVEEKDEHDGHGHDENEGGVELNSIQLEQGDISITALQPRIMQTRVYAPGEIKSNGYTSYLVSPRVDSVVLRRHASLGDHVSGGKPLVTLFSEAVAEAQADYRIAASEWRQQKQLKNTAISDIDLITAQTESVAAYSRLVAYGLSEKEINQLNAPQSTWEARLGEYTLYAEHDGAVLTDDFHQGQRVEAGSALMELANETELWVEANLASTSKTELPKGTQAQVEVNGETFTALVTQEAHTINPVTRTRTVRLLIDNSEHRLHPGLFVDVYFPLPTEEPILAVPETALMRSTDGDWTLFVEEQPGRFAAKEVKLGRSFGGWHEITGIETNTRVVTEGAFFVASQIAKGGFDPHNH